jgi:YesN/AraC family two-component response regulator
MEITSFITPSVPFAERRFINMYKVVIVDDEPIIVEGLSRSFPWEQWECQVVGTAESGAEGIQVVNRTQPDLLITDISMPEIDGLTMIAALKTQHPHLETVPAWPKCQHILWFLH